MKKLWILAFAALIVAAACSRGGNAAVSSAATGLTGEVMIMGFNGDGVVYWDIGNQNWAPEDIKYDFVASMYASAKEFAKKHPNVKINYFAKEGGPNDDNGSWEQHRENFRVEHGVYPDIYKVTDMTGDIQKGLIADLSIFRNDPDFGRFNSGVLDTLTVEGRLFGIPDFIVPSGVFVNKSLAEMNNIDVPDPDWTIDDYTRFVSNSRRNAYYGSMGRFDDELALINTGTRDISYSLLNYRPGQDFVNINSDPVRSLLRHLDQWTRNSVQGNWDMGLISQEFMDESWWWSYKFWTDGRTLVNPGQGWMIGAAGNPEGDVTADWDYYPRPSTPYMGNTLGVVNDPFVIRNYAMDDGNPELSDAERAKLEVAWEFAKFFKIDTDGWQARANQLFFDGERYATGLGDSFPVTIGAEFQRQMEIWYQIPQHQRFKDAALMPGFRYVVELWERGEIWEVSDKVFPWNHTFEGNRRMILYEWYNAANPDITGAARIDANWLDVLYSRLPGWNAAVNQRWADEERLLEAALNRYYPQR